MARILLTARGSGPHHGYMTTKTSHYLGLPIALLYDDGTLVLVKFGFTTHHALRRLA